MAKVEALEREADRCKAQFETRLEQVKQRLSPAGLAEEAMNAVDFPGRVATAAVLDSVRRNPLLALGLAAGAGWLILGARHSAVRGSKRARTRKQKRMKEIDYGSRNS
ncbi:MAG: hypothetical protein ACREDW_10795 [Aestuariivirgaceae bacterium]